LLSADSNAAVQAFVTAFESCESSFAASGSAKNAARSMRVAVEDCEPAAEAAAEAVLEAMPFAYERLAANSPEIRAAPAPAAALRVPSFRIPTSASAMPSSGRREMSVRRHSSSANVGQAADSKAAVALARSLANQA